MIFSLKRGGGAAGARGRRPAGVVDDDVEPAVLRGDGGDHRRHRGGVADIAGHEVERAEVRHRSLRPTATTVAPAAAKRSLMARPMLRVPPVTSTTCPVKSRGSAMSPGDSARSVNRAAPFSDASSGFATVSPVGITSTVDERGIAEVVMDNPPVNALTVAGWFELADTITALGRDPASASWCCGPRAGASTPASTSRRCRRPEGFEALHRRQPRLLRRLRRRLRVPRAGHRRRQRLLPRRWHRPGGQRRCHRRRRRRHLRAPGGRPRCARRGHPPLPARAPAQDAGDGVHVGDGDGPGAAPLRQRPRGRAGRRAARRGPPGRRRPSRRSRRRSSGPPRSRSTASTCGT